LTDDTPNFGLGARRIVESQKLMVVLAAELNLTLEKAIGDEPRWTHARGLFEVDNLDNLVVRYTNLVSENHRP